MSISIINSKYIGTEIVVDDTLYVFIKTGAVLALLNLESYETEHYWSSGKYVDFMTKDQSLKDAIAVVYQMKGVT